MAIDNEVRAAGRIVVWQLRGRGAEHGDDQELDRDVAEARRAEHELAGGRQHVVGVVGEEVGALHRLGGEGDDHEDATRMNVERTPARPGVLFESLHSSFTLVAVSQPQ